MTNIESKETTVEITKVILENGEIEATIRRDNLVAVLNGVLYNQLNGGWKPIGGGTANDVADCLCNLGILKKNYKRKSSKREFGGEKKFVGYTTENHDKAKELLDKHGRIEKTYFIKPRHGDKTKFDDREKAEEKMEELEERNKDISYEIEIKKDIV